VMNYLGGHATGSVSLSVSDEPLVSLVSTGPAVVRLSRSEALHLPVLARVSPCVSPPAAAVEYHLSLQQHCILTMILKRLRLPYDL
jgi:hypothetical protein